MKRLDCCCCYNFLTFFLVRKMFTHKVITNRTLHSSDFGLGLFLMQRSYIFRHSWKGARPELLWVRSSKVERTNFPQKIFHPNRIEWSPTSTILIYKKIYFYKKALEKLFRYLHWKHVSWDMPHTQCTPFSFQMYIFSCQP